MRTVVIGAGKSGVAAANFLAQQGEDVILSDSNPRPDLPYALDDRVVRIFGDQNAGLLQEARQIVLSPGVPTTIPLVREAMKRRVPVISEIELAMRNLRGTVAAITGSNGKSTTTALLGEILKASGRQPIVAGNIGEPLTAAIDLEKARMYVLELSSFQLETVDTFHANVALLLNITPDHMDRYDTVEAYAAAKQRIFRNQTEKDTAIVNANLTGDVAGGFGPLDGLNEVRGAGGPRLWRFTAAARLDGGAWLEGDEMVLAVDGKERRIRRALLKLQGVANVENALAAWLAARALDVDDDAVRAAFESFGGLPHRMVLVRDRGGVRWVNDSKGTNVDATLKSLESFAPASVLLILGGKDKSGEFERMRELVGEKARAVITIGKAANRIAAALEGAATIVPARDMDHAVEWAAQNAKEGDTVLLSPACASFDQYRNFEHRGQHFEELVGKL